MAGPVVNHHPWLVRAIAIMEGAQTRLSVVELREMLGDPAPNKAGHLLCSAEAKGYVHSIGRGLKRRYTLGKVALPLPRAQADLIGRGAPRVPSVWAWASVHDVQQHEIHHHQQETR